MSDDLERIFLRVRSKYCLPGGVLPDTDGLAKVLLVSARVTPLETFKRTAELILQAFKKSTNECLRNGYIQAMSCNDVQTAQTCLNILQNQNNNHSGSISQTEYPSCSNLSSFGSASKNLSLQSNKAAQNENYRLDASVSLVRADSNLNINNPLGVIVEREEENARNSSASGLIDNRRGTAKLKSCQTSADQNQGGKKHRFSQPSKQTPNDEQEVSPKRPINSRPVNSRTNEENAFVKNNKVKSRPSLGSPVHQRSESEDSEELFRPSQSKKPSPQNKRHREKSDYPPVNSRRDESINQDSSDVYSSPQHLPRKADRPRNRTYRRQYSSESEDYNKSKFNRVFEKKKRDYSKKTTKQCYSDSDIPSPTKTKVQSSKLKSHETTDSESENDRKRSRTVKNILSNRRKRIHADSDSEEPYRQDPKPQRSKSAGTKSLKRSRSYPSETSLSPNSLKYKSTEKLKRGKIKQNVYSDSEAVMDASSQRKPARRNKKTLKDSEPRSAKSQSKVTEKADKKEVNKPSPKPRNNAGKSDGKSTTNRRKKSVESKGKEQENLPSTSKDLSQPSKSNNLKFMSKLKELESSILNGTPDPLPTKRTNNSKKSVSASKKVNASNQNIQDSAQRDKPRNKKPPTKSPVAKNKRKPSASKVNKKTADKPSAAQSRAAKTQKPGAEKNPRKKPVSTKSKSASECKSTKEKPENIKTKCKKTVAKKPKEKVEKEKVGTVSQSKETLGKETKSEDDGENTEVDKNINSLLSSDESFRSDSELEAPLGSLSTCLNSIKRQMPRQVGTATPPLRIFLSTNSDILSDSSETSSFDRVPIKLDDKNVVKRMAKANRPKQMEDDRPTSSKPPKKLPETPETLRKMMKINKKFEEKQDSDVECSSFSDN